MTQFLLHLPNDIEKAHREKQVEILLKGGKKERGWQGKILIDWIRKGMEAEKKERGS